MKLQFLAVITVSISLVITSCAPVPNDVAMKVGEPPQSEEKTTLDLRSMQTRRFDTLNEKRLLAAGTQTLQDLGYSITESASDVGVLAGSKQRDAEESGQIAGQVAVTILLALLGSHHNPTWDKSQNIVVTVITMPIENSNQTDVRVAFDRRITNNHGDLWRTELILDQKIYQEFFEKFSKSAFLEAHGL